MNNYYLLMIQFQLEITVVGFVNTQCLYSHPLFQTSQSQFQTKSKT